MDRQHAQSSCYCYNLMGSWQCTETRQAGMHQGSNKSSAAQLCFRGAQVRTAADNRAVNLVAHEAVTLQATYACLAPVILHCNCATSLTCNSTPSLKPANCSCVEPAVKCCCVALIPCLCARCEQSKMCQAACMHCCVMSVTVMPTAG